MVQQVQLNCLTAIAQTFFVVVQYKSHRYLKVPNLCLLVVVVANFYQDVKVVPHTVFIVVGTSNTHNACDLAFYTVYILAFHMMSNKVAHYHMELQKSQHEHSQSLEKWAVVQHAHAVAGSLAYKFESTFPSLLLIYE